MFLRTKADVLRAAVKSLCLVCLFVRPVISISAAAEDLVGIWQGKLQTTTRALRLVAKVDRTDSGGMECKLYSIDQGPQGFACTATLQGSKVKIVVPAVNGVYEGKFDFEKGVLTGGWSQGAAPMALMLNRVNESEAWEIPRPAPPPAPIAADVELAFDAASVKPSRVDAQGKGFSVRGREFSTYNTSVNDLIAFAYGLHTKQIVGGPAWTHAERYDILAKPDQPGIPNQAQWKQMLRKFLTERCHLEVHNDKREISVYAITVSKGGPKLTQSAASPNAIPRLVFTALGVLPASNATIADFADAMQSAVLDMPVVDQTGLAGRYDFVLKWTPDEFQFGGVGAKVPPPDSAAAAPDLNTAMQQQLGLRLGSAKAVVGVVVVDAVTRPVN